MNAATAFRVLTLLSVVLLVACLPGPPDDAGLTVVTAFPTLDSGDPAALCAAVEINWNANWPRVIEVLELLIAQGADCAAEQPSAARLYAARLSYGRMLEDAGRMAEAVAQYEAAVALNPGGVEAIRALRDLGVFTPSPLVTCTALEAEQALAALPRYEPTDRRDLVTIAGDRFLVGEELYVVQGVNYYPMRYPWRRFLTEADLGEIRFELALLMGAGFNTLRLFLWNEALFTCPGNGPIPVVEAFERLDAVIQAAAAYGFRLIVTLNDLADLGQYPLYSSPAHINEQTAFLVERYRDEAAILAWDLRNEGDIDYLPIGDIGGGFAREEVLTWLAETAALVRAVDDRHLITAGWFRDAEATIPFVDFVSLHHWDDASTLRERIAQLRGYTDKPILLEEFGYSTYQLDEAQQSRFLREAIQAAEYDGLAGWLIWTAFDFPTDVTCLPPACPSEDSIQHHFGLWRTDHTPKMALDVLEVLIGQRRAP